MEYPSPLYDADLGASTTTLAQYNFSYYNGIELPSYFSGLGTNALASLHYGNATQPSNVIISQHSGIPTSQSLTSVGFIKNPAANSGYITKISIIKYAAGQYYPTVLYEASYTNYFNTIPALVETQPPVSVSFATTAAYTTTSMTISGKNYGTAVDTTSRIYVYLRNLANGFEYASINSVTCPGFTVEWLQTGYIFFLTPLSNLGTTPTIVCTGFVLSVNIEDIQVETGIHKEGYGRTADSYNTATVGTNATQLSGDSSTVGRTRSQFKQCELRQPIS